jgi:hypothetical protein
MMEFGTQQDKTVTVSEGQNRISVNFALKTLGQISGIVLDTIARFQSLRLKAQEVELGPARLSR